MTTGNYDPSPGRLHELLAMPEPPAHMEIGRDPGGNSDLLEMLLAVLSQAEEGYRTKITVHGEPVAMIAPVTRDSGPDVFKATVYGNSYPELIEAAETEARGFYGPDAPLVVEHTGAIWSTISVQARLNRGEYSTTVTIRCTQLPDGWDVP